MSRLFAPATTEYFQRDTALITAAPITIACRGKCDSSADQRTIGGVFDASVTNSMFALRLQDAGNGTVLEYIAESPTVEVAIVTTTSYTVGVWHSFIGLSASTTDHRVYIDNGSVASSATEVTPTGIDRTTIGRLGDSTPKNEFSGLLASFAIWKVALSAGERQAYHDGVSPIRIQPGNLVEWFELMEVSGDALSAIGNAALTDNGTVTTGDHPPIQPMFGFTSGWQGAFTAAAVGGIAVLRRRYEGY